jgi:hypothetical protein
MVSSFRIEKPDAPNIPAIVEGDRLYLTPGL